MATAVCQDPDCGHSWELNKEPEEYSDYGPKCSDCGGREVEIEGAPRFSESLLKEDDRTERLREALEDCPGVGEQKIRYCVGWYERDPEVRENPEALVDLLAEVEGIEQHTGRRVARFVFQDEDADSDPLDVGGDDEPAETGGSGLDSIIKAKRAGLLGDEGGGAGDVAEAVQAGLESVAESQRLLASSLKSERDRGTSEVEQLREELEELREERRRSEIRQLEERVDEAVAAAKQSPAGLSNDPEVAEIEAADAALERLASKLPEGDELLQEIRKLGSELGYTPGVGQPTPQHWWSESPSERQQTEGDEGFNYQPQYGQVQQIDPEEMAESSGGTEAARPGPPGDDDVAELWNDLTGQSGPEKYECQVCDGIVFSYGGPGHPSCPECGDATPRRLESEAERGIE